MTPIPKRPCLYCRLSYAPDGSLEKVERQEADGRLMGSRLGWPDFCCVYVDNSRSAWQRNRKRPDWDRMLLTLDKSGQRLIPHDPKANHRHDGIMTYHGDRLIRQPYDLELLLNVADASQIPLGSVSGVRNLSSPDDRFILRIEAAQACRESDNISRRQKVGSAARKKKGRGQSGGRRPYGWGVPTGRTKTKVDRDTQEEIEVEVLDFNKVRPDEAKHLADVAGRILAGLSTAGGVRFMNGVSTTTAGGPWSSRVLISMLTSPRIAGLIEHEGTLYKAEWEPVISREEWEDLKALFAHKKKAYPAPTRERVHLLSGRAECGLCDSSDVRTKPMGGRRRNKKPGYERLRVYYCRGCHGVARNVELLDMYVEGQVLRVLSDPRFGEEVAAASREGNPSVVAEIAELERRRDETKEQLEDLADHPEIDAGLAMKAVASFDRKVKRLRDQMAATSQIRLLSRMIGISKEQWEAEAVDVRATVVGILYRVVILPTTRRGPGFDPTSVRVTRKPLARPTEQEQDGGAAGSRGAES